MLQSRSIVSNFVKFSFRAIDINLSFVFLVEVVMFTKFNRLTSLIKGILKYINSGYFYLPLDKGAIIYDSDSGSLFVHTYNLILNTDGYIAQNCDREFIIRLLALQRINDKEGIKQLLLEEANKTSIEIERLYNETSRMSR